MTDGRGAPPTMTAEQPRRATLSEYTRHLEVAAQAPNVQALLDAVRHAVGCHELEAVTNPDARRVPVWWRQVADAYRDVVPLDEVGGPR